MRETFAQKDKRLFEETQKAWNSKSETYKQRFECVKDPLIIVEFLKESKHAIKEPWVNNEILRAMQEGHGEFLRPIASMLEDKREQKMQTTAIISLSTMIAVDRLIADGIKQHEAFNHLVEKMRKTQPEEGWTYDVVKNRYFRCRKKWRANKLTEVHVEKDNEWTCISAFPAITSIHGRNFASRWEIRMCVGKEDKVSCTLWDLDPSSLPIFQVGQCL